MELALISNKTYKISWQNSETSIPIEIHIPDLTNLKYFVWGDWGPMYIFNLNHLEPIRIKWGNSYLTSSQKILRIESPKLALEREKHLFYLVIDNPDPNVRIGIYLNHNYGIEKIEIKEKLNTAEGIDLIGL